MEDSVTSNFLPSSVQTLLKSDLGSENSVTGLDFTTSLKLCCYIEECLGHNQGGSYSRLLNNCSALGSQCW